MFFAKLARLIEDHSEQIVTATLRHIDGNPNLERLGSLSDSSLVERGKHVLAHLTQWMDPSQREALAKEHERAGKVQCEQGIPLHESVLALQLLRNQAVEYITKQLNGTYVELYAEEELERWLSNFFDSLIYALVKGYEAALREKTRPEMNERKARWEMLWVP
jgi:hypothetical protein